MEAAARVARLRIGRAQIFAVVVVVDRVGTAENGGFEPPAVDGVAPEFGHEAVFVADFEVCAEVHVVPFQFEQHLIVAELDHDAAAFCGRLSFGQAVVALAGGRLG